MSSNPEVINVGIIGCGRWGRNYIRAIEELAGASVSIVCDSNYDQLAKVELRYPNLRTTGVLKTVLGSSEVSATIIATPAATHYELIKKCLLAGKHVLVEKPMVTSVEQAEEVVELAQTQGLILMVGHTFLYNAGILKMKECMWPGKVYYLHSTRTNLGPIRRDVDAIWDLAPHDIAIFGYLLGEQPIWASAIGTKVLGSDKVDVGFITLGYQSGIVGNIHVSWLNPNKVREVVAVGSGSRVVFNDLCNVEPVRVFKKGVAYSGAEASNFGEFRLCMGDGDIISPKVEASEPLKNQCAHFLHCITSGVMPTSDGQNGLDVVRVLVAVSESVEAHGKPVEIQRKGNSFD